MNSTDLDFCMRSDMHLFSIRSCLNCGSWSVQKSMFCNCCSKTLLANMKLEEAFGFQNMQIRALFRWIPGQSDALSQLVLQLKDSPATVWEYYAKRFLETSLVMPSNALLVSSLSTSKRRHAQNWGDCLSKLTGIPHVVGLKIKEIGVLNVQQKELSKRARKQREFEKIADFSVEKLDLIFVDDVVTTGATALAAYSALGRPRNFQVWCLASRELSCIASPEASW